MESDRLMRIDFDALPDGNIYAANGQIGYVLVESEDQLATLVQATVDLADREEIGQLLNLMISPEQGLSVWIDTAGGLGWALMFDSATEHLVTVGDQVKSGEVIDLKFGDSWEEQPASSFVDARSANTAVLEFWRTRERPTCLAMEPYL